MTWESRRRNADHAWRLEREQAEAVPCPECEASAGAQCTNTNDGLPLERQPAHWRRIKAAEEKR